MSQAQFAPPSPEVQHLPTLLRRVQSGEIRVPAFQREYVWTEKQIIELLESIYNGYPIGSLLFWQPTIPSIAIKLDAEFPIPQSSEKQPATYILDGQQRLATIYNCFFWKSLDLPNRFNVTFDLRNKTFVHHQKGGSGAGRIHLGSLFVPKAFLSVQQSLAKEKDSEALLDNAIALHAAFQEYMIPMVSIKGRDTADVVKVFERINNTGVRLSAVDFMRAVTWSENFDLTAETSALSREVEELGFLIPAETLVKIIAISRGLDPSPGSMLKLREFDVSALRGATELVRRVLAGAIQFFKDHLCIYSYEYVPYEAQMLVIAKLFLASDFKPSAEALATIKRWLIRTSAGEELQGKADSVIANIVHAVSALVAGDARSFDGRLELAPEELATRKFIVRRALSSALAMMFAHRKARSIFTGQVIEAQDYMSEFASAHFMPIGEPPPSAESRERRPFANLLLVSEDDRRALKGTRAADIITMNNMPLPLKIALDSQAISRESVDALRSGEWAAFLASRSRDILSALHGMLGTNGTSE